METYQKFVEMQKAKILVGAVDKKQHCAVKKKKKAKNNKQTSKVCHAVRNLAGGACLSACEKWKSKQMRSEIERNGSQKQMELRLHLFYGHFHFSSSRHCQRQHSIWCKYTHRIH